MELKTIKEPVSCGRLAYDSFAEQAVESDILLPDYLPDVIRVLGCRAEPKILSCQGEGRRITLDGMTLISLSYASDDGRIHTVEQRLPFSRTAEARTELVKPVFLLDTRVDYLNCRAVSKRRLDIRGAFTAGIRVMTMMSADAVTDASGGGIQLRRGNITSVYPIGESRRQTTVREELELGYGKPAAISIIRTSARCTAAECKIIAGKIVAKGEVWLHVLYDTENDGLQSMDYSVPVSQIVDMDGLGEDCLCDVRFEAAAAEVKIAGGEAGEQNTLSAEITLITAAKVMGVCGMAVASDAYSTAYISQTETSQLTLISGAESVDMHSTVRETQTLPDDVAEIKDLWCEARSWEIKNTENGVEAECRIMIRMFAADAQGAPVYYEKASSFTWSRAAEPGAICDIAFAITGCSYTREGANGLDIRIETDVTGTIYNVRGVEVLSAVTLTGEPAKSPVADGTALTIYYADEGEDVWGIAKRYLAPVNAVMEENALESERIPARTMLLIPMTQAE